MMFIMLSGLSKSERSSAPQHQLQEITELTDENRWEIKRNRINSFNLTLISENQSHSLSMSWWSERRRQQRFIFSPNLMKQCSRKCFFSPQGQSVTSILFLDLLDVVVLVLQKEELSTNRKNKREKKQTWPQLSQRTHRAVSKSGRHFNCQTSLLLNLEVSAPSSLLETCFCERVSVRSGCLRWNSPRA